MSTVLSSALTSTLDPITSPHMLPLIPSQGSLILWRVVQRFWRTSVANIEPKIWRRILMKRSHFLALPSLTLTRTALTHLWSSTTVDHICLIGRKSHTTFWLSMQWSPGYICNSISRVLHAMRYLPFSHVSLHLLIWVSRPFITLHSTTCTLSVNP